MRSIMTCGALSILVVVATASPGSACGLREAHLQRGTPIQELTISGHDRPTMGYGTMHAAITSASIVARPCHGTLTVTSPPGFLYVPAPGFAGVDMYAVRGCRGLDRCDVTAAVITVRQ